MEHEYGLIGGNIFHGELTPDQLFHMRPAPGYADFTTPIDGLYQCSSATHGGGGVTGIPALLCTRRVLADARRRRRTRRLRRDARMAGHDAAVGVAAPIDADALAPVLDPPARGRMLPRGRLPRRRRPGVGARRTSSPAAGCAPAGRPTSPRSAPGGPSRSATTPCCWCAATTACCAGSPTCAATAATSWCRAAPTSDAPLDPLPVPRLALRARRRAAVDAALRRAGRVRPRASTAWSRCAVEEWHGWVMVNARGDAPPLDEFLAGLERTVAGVRARAPRRRRHAPATSWRQLEADRRELPRVLPLPEHPPGAVRGEPADERREPRSATRVLGRRLAGPDAARGRRCRSTGESPAAPLPRPRRRRRGGAIDYLGLLPNLLDQPAPRLRDDPPHRAAGARPHGGRVPVAVRPRGRRPPTASTRRSPSTSGTSPTARTGRRARACSAASRPAATARARSPTEEDARRPVRPPRGPRLPRRRLDPLTRRRPSAPATASWPTDSTHPTTRSVSDGRATVRADSWSVRS